jgi:hypothetical protein
MIIFIETTFTDVIMYIFCMGAIVPPEHYEQTFAKLRHKRSHPSRRPAHFFSAASARNTSPSSCGLHLVTAAFSMVAHLYPYR